MRGQSGLPICISIRTFLEGSPLAKEYDMRDNTIDLQMITNKMLELGVICNVITIVICNMQYAIFIGITNDCNKNMSRGILLLCNITLVSG